jgi:hypothetical protein
MIEQCKIVPFIDKIPLIRLMIEQSRCCTVDHQLEEARFLRSLYGDRRLQDFVSSASKFNSIVVKMLKLVLCSSRDGVPLKLKKQSWRQYSSSIQIV